MKKDKFDAFFFMPGPEEDTVKVEGAAYKVPGDPIDQSEMGNMYHIILFKEDAEGNITNPDLFEAILIEPLEYVSRMITCDFYGLVAKKTTTSSEFIQSTFDKLKNF
ncbi:MAG: hypothetical protein EBU90_13925 [Proteobacteria bacterium]|nr:hypothetical protein [Pseudomonadota bacterium]